MTEGQLHGALVWAIFAMAAATFLILLRFTAPYGRHYRGRGWGPQIANRAGWIVMELPATVMFLYVYCLGQHAWQLVPLVFLGMWQVHYLNRTFVYPFRTRTKGRKMPVLVVGSGFLFNVINAYVNARFVSHIGEYGLDWLGDPRFLAGLAIFLAGLALNIHSDNILLRLRKADGAGRGPGNLGSVTDGYAIPHGGAFRWVSCPNYLGELLEWAGWALATWSLGGLAFFVYAVANLVPRARSNHRWYRGRFEDYPESRRAVIPGVI